jgi:hypothetical protein
MARASLPGMEDAATAKMSSPATLEDESSPWQSSANEEDLVHEESMLKRKLAILEEFTDHGETFLYARSLFSQEDDGFARKAVSEGCSKPDHRLVIVTRPHCPTLLGNSGINRVLRSVTKQFLTRIRKCGAVFGREMPNPAAKDRLLGRGYLQIRYVSYMRILNVVLILL